MPELPLQLNSLDVNPNNYQAGRSLPVDLLFLRKNQVEHDGGNAARRNAGREQGFQPLGRKLQD
ncbi:hypothetical protein AL522_22700 [Pantoea vagans]|nr:hypothetical protein AL522_22700 [Pantoea vagans]